MNHEKFKKYAINTVALIKKQALAAKNTEHSNKTPNDYASGVVMGYYSIITLLKHQAFAFCIDQKELGLADIQPDTDLLNLDRNPNIDYGEDNWAIEIMSEERVKGYLCDSIKLLKAQALEAKKDADYPEEGFKDFNEGSMMAYHSAIALLKDQASVFKIDKIELGL